MLHKSRSRRSCGRAERLSRLTRRGGLFERLEERCLLATHAWDGGGPDNLWSTPENWAGDVAPIAGDDLIFGSGAVQLATSNNFPEGTLFRSIAFTAAGYSIGGNDITAEQSVGINAALTTSESLSITVPQIAISAPVSVHSDLSLDATRISFTTNLADMAAIGSSAITLTADESISLVAGSSITATDGDVTLAANPDGLATGTFVGISVAGAAISTTGAGDVSLDGRGGNTGNSQYGVNLQGGGTVRALGTGSVTVHGQGGSSTGSSAYGVLIENTGSLVTSAGGNVSVVGIAGGTGASSNNSGIRLGFGVISAGGLGSVSVQGTGGASDGPFNPGVELLGGGSLITSSGGNVLVVGQGGGTAASGDNRGVMVSGAGVITAGVNGNVVVQGTGGLGSLGGNHGVMVTQSGSSIKSSGGNVQITGTGGGGASGGDHGVSVISGGQLTAGGNGSVTVTGTGGVGSNGAEIGVQILGATSSITSGGGSVSVTGTGGSNAASAGNHGLLIDTGKLTAGNDGDVTVTGRGAGAFGRGVTVASGGQITAGGLGSVDVTGFGGSAAGHNQNGVMVFLAGSTISSSGGDVQVTGTGGGSGTSGDNRGVYVWNGGQLRSGGSGAITVQGTGGGGSGNNNHGLVVEGTGAAITSTGGAVQATGTGGGSGSSASNHGVLVSSSGQITAGGGGAVAVEGLGGGGSGTSGSQGVRLEGTGVSISTTGGNVHVSGTGGTTSAGGNEGVLVLSGAQIAAGGSGSVEVHGAGGSSVGGTDIGVTVQSGTVTSAGGNVQVTGLGGSGTNGNNWGVYVVSNSVITAGPAGTVTVDGTGGASSGHNNYGLVVEGNGATITSAGGAVQATGTGGGSGASSLNFGVWVNSGSISAGGGGAVNVVGVGGSNTSGSSNFGVRVSGTTGLITSAGGPIEVTGTGGGAGAGGLNSGVNLGSSGRIAAGGIGTVMVVGVGGNATGGSNHGVLLSTNALITSGGGAVEVTGTGGSGAGGGNGVYVDSQSQITAGDLGIVTVSGQGGVASTSSTHGVAVFDPGSAITSSGGPVQVTGTGGGAANSGGNRGVYVDFGGNVSAGGTGTVSVAGTSGSGTGGANLGVFVNGAGSTITSGGGDVLVSGIGRGNSLANGGDNSGVYLASGGKIAASASGTVTVEGDGGGGLGGGNRGVRVSGIGTDITSGGGAVSVVGDGGAGGGNNEGVFVHSGGRVTSAGNGSVTVTGAGGSGGGANQGVVVFATGSAITSNGGNVQVTGTGGAGAGSDNYGLRVATGGHVAAGGGGTVSVIGSGGSGSGGFNFGVHVNDVGAAITSNGGDISVEGIAGAGSNSTAIVIESAGTVTAPGAGIVTLRGNSMRLDSTVNAGANRVVLQPTSIGHQINLGSTSDSTANTLELSGAELDRITAGTLQIGDLNAGPIAISGIVDTANTQTLHLLSGSTLTQSAPIHEENLAIRSGGVALTTAGNEWDTIAVDSKFGTVFLREPSGFTVGSVDSINGIAATGPVTLDSSSNSGFGSITVSDTPAASDISGLSLDVLTSAQFSLSAGANVTGLGDRHVYTANRMDIAGTINASGRTVFISPRSVFNLDLGSASNTTPDTLELSDDELDRITASALHLTSGTIRVVAPIDRPASTDVLLVSSSEAIVFNPGSLDTNGGTLLLMPGSGGVQPLTSGVDAAASTVSLSPAAALTIEINGTVADTGFSQLNVDGAVDLPGVELVLQGVHVPANGDVFRIVSASSGVAGQFNGLTDGDVVIFNGQPLRINYHATSVTLTADVNDTPRFTALSVDSPVIQENGSVTLSGSFADLDALDTHEVLIDWGDASPPTTLQLTGGARTFTATHRYLDDNPSGTPEDQYAIHVTLTDDDDASVTRTAGIVTVVNQPPALVFDPVAAIEENGVATLTGSITDASLPGLAQVIDFEELGHAGSGVGPTFNSFNSDGFVFRGYSGNLGVGEDAEALTSMGSNTPSAYPGSAGLLNRFFDGTTQLMREDGRPFDLVSLDLSESNRDAPNAHRTVAFIGTKTDGSTVTASVTTDGTFGFETVQFENFTALVSVHWRNRSTHVDNVRVQSPTTESFSLELNWGDPLSPNNSQSFLLGAIPLSRAVHGISWDPATRLFAIEHQYLDVPGGSPQVEYTIHATLTDDDGGSASTIARVDQQFDPFSVAGSINFAGAVTSDFEWAQTFTAGTAGTLTGVEVFVNGSDAVSDLLVDIRPTNASGVPLGSATNLASVTVPRQSVSDSYGFVPVDLTQFNVLVAPGQVLAIVVRAADPLATGQYNVGGQPGNPFAAGQLYFRGGGFGFSTRNGDIGFKTLVRQVTPPTVTVLNNEPLTVSVTATDSNAAEPDNDGQFAVTLSQPSATPTSISYTISGTATSGADYAALSGTVVVPAGVTSVAIPVDVADDSILEATETVVMTIVATDNPNITVGPANTATVSIADDDTAVVSVIATDPSAAEPTNPGQFTVSLSRLSATSTTISYTIGGTATSGADYVALSGTVVIPANTPSATIPVDVIDDLILESTETVVATLVSTSNPAITVSASNTATVSIADDDTATVSVTATDAGAAEPNNPGQFTVSLSQLSATPTTISYTLSGTATSGVDYAALGGTVLIPAGVTSVSIPVDVINDPIVEGTETVVMSLVSTSNPAITVGASSTATVSIGDDDAGIVTVTATDPSAAEPNNPGQFTVSLSQLSATATTISYALSGTATTGADYTPLSGTVVIPANTPSATIPVNVIEDSIVETTETIVVTLVGANNPAIGVDASPATINLLDNDTATVSVTATDANAGEPNNNGQFTVSLSQLSATPTTISYSLSGTATTGLDYSALSGTVVIPAGVTSATIPVNVIDDFVVEPTETVVLTLVGTSNPAITVGPSNAATVTITSNDTAIVTLAATVPNAAEPNNDGQFTVTLSHPSATPTTIFYSTGGSATKVDDYAPLSGTVDIPANTTSVTIPVDVIDNSILEGTETVLMTLQGTNNPNIVIGFPNTATVGIADDDTADKSPALTNSFAGVTFSTDANNTGFFHIPPDPSSAVGRTHLVSVVNTSIEWHSKVGGLQQSQSLKTFFTTLSPAQGTDGKVFDPKVIYDQFAGRFVVVTLDQSNINRTARILLAVSRTENPNDGWRFQAINSKLSINGTDTWADYPGFAVDEEAIYITANMFQFDGGPFVASRLWIVGNSGLYSGAGPSSVNVHDPSIKAGLPGQAFTLQPAHMLTAHQSLGTFLVSTGWVDGQANNLLSVIRVDNPLVAAPSFSNQFISAGRIDSGGALPDAPQPGSTVRIETNDARALHAVWRNNQLWTVNTVIPPSGPDAGQATTHWYKVNTSNLGALVLADQGNIGGNDIDPQAHTYFPTIAVDQFDNMAVGFALSSPNHYAGAYYAARLASDPPGTIRSTQALAAGVAPYVRTFGGPRNRWGDYTGLSIDPIDGQTFWAFNQFASTQGQASADGDGRWGTQIGNFSFKTPVVQLSGGIGEIKVERNGDNLQVRQNGAVLYSQHLSQLSGFALKGTPASETFRVTINGLSPASLPSGIWIHAGEGIGDDDTLILSGSQTVNNFQYTTGGPEAGTIYMDGLTVYFTQFEPIVDELTVVDRRFEIGTIGDQSIRLADNGLPNDGFSTLDSAATGAFESITFQPPIGTLQISAGDGDDVITVASLDASWVSPVSINGDAGDDVLDASAFNLSIVLAGGPDNDTLIGGSAIDTLLGGDGDDTLATGNGTDLVDGGAGDNTVTVDLGADVSLGEGDTLSFSLASSLLPATIDWGDGHVDHVDDGNEPVVAEHRYADNGQFQLVLTTADGAGGAAVTVVTVSVANVAPVLSVSAPANVDEGALFLVSLAASDPGADTIHQWRIDWGDGVVENVPGDRTSAGHAYADGPNVHSISISAADEDGVYAANPVMVAVTNVTPTIGAISAPLDPRAVNTAVSLSATIADVGAGDTHTAVWTWGDNTISAGTVTMSGGIGTVSGSHSYSAAGVYTVKLTITDDDGAAIESTFQFVVVYDPSAGFITGGGWIDSPPGAYAPDPTLVGKANFGFVSKYKNGTSTPDGQTQFQFKAGDVNFHSTSYEWLVIAGAKGKFKGEGTINGQGRYGFMLTATDGQASGGGGIDKFRIKIWDKNNADVIVYDNKPGAGDDSYDGTALGGGSIVLHKSGQSLTAAAGIAVASPTLLTQPLLDAAVTEAIAGWAAAGISSRHSEALAAIDVDIAEFSGATLGLASNSTNKIWLDVDGAGLGWSIDAGGYDLVSAVSHELGHVLGFDHERLGETLEPGEVHLASEHFSDRVPDAMSRLNSRDAVFASFRIQQTSQSLGSNRELNLDQVSASQTKSGWPSNRLQQIHNGATDLVFADLGDNPQQESYPARRRHIKTYAIISGRR